jgi:phage terminase large subunit GpA-like protein
MTLALNPAVLATFEEAARVLAPPSKVTVLQWGERERILSSESSSDIGRYRSARAPYQRAMMEAVHLPGVEEIVFFTAAQIGKSLCLENIFGYFVSEDPCPVIWMWPTDDVAKAWSADTLDPMLRDTPVLADLVTGGEKKIGNRALFKRFPGGWLSIVGANAPAGLRRRRARVLICDEVDGYPPSSGKEGDPIELVRQRSVTFWNALCILASTGTLKGFSRIEARYENSNKQKFWVPCPHCDEFQVLSWRQISFPANEEPTVENTYCACLHCGAALTEVDKKGMLDRGEWRAEHPEIVKRHGFWISALYSPFETWAQLAAKFKNAINQRENPEILKAFINLSLAETWEEKEDSLDREQLRKRCEDYPQLPSGKTVLPDGVTVLTAGVDVQPDRLELELVGWGKGEESWSIDWRRFDGDTSRPEVWEALDEYLARHWTHARGPEMEIAATFIDSGYYANEVYAFTKTRNDRGIFASKGSSNFSHAPLAKWNRNNRHRVKMYPVGVSAIKKLIYSRLRIENPGAGYLHFSRETNDAEYFDQLTVERLRKKYDHGFPVLFWEKPAGSRNEALDCRVYAYAAFLSLSENPRQMLDRLRQDLIEEAKQMAAERKAKVDPNQLALLETIEVPLLPPEGEIASVAPAPPPAIDEKGENPEKTQHPPEQISRPIVRVRRSTWL